MISYVSDQNLLLGHRIPYIESLGQRLTLVMRFCIFLQDKVVKSLLPQRFLTCAFAYCEILLQIQIGAQTGFEKVHARSPVSSP